MLVWGGSRHGVGFFALHLGGPKGLQGKFWPLGWKSEHPGPSGPGSPALVSSPGVSPGGDTWGPGSPEAESNQTCFVQAEHEGLVSPAQPLPDVIRGGR